MATLNVYPTGIPDTPYVAQINFDSVQKALTGSAPAPPSSGSPSSGSPSSGSPSKATSNLETIILLDVSGSMGQNVSRIVRDYIPNALEKAGYRPKDKVSLVTFSNGATIYEYSVVDFRQSSLSSQGNTFMRPGVDLVRNIIIKSKARDIRIITISDGELHDQIETFQAASKLAAYLKDVNGSVASSAIRLFTSSSQPDTRGLSSMLQLDTASRSSAASGRTLVDIDASNDRSLIIQMITELFNDKLGRNRVLLTSDQPFFLRSPWSTMSTEIGLNEGENTFWLKRLPSKDDMMVIKASITDDKTGLRSKKKIEVFLKAGDQLDYESYNGILKERVDYFMSRLRILKVLNTPEAEAEVKSIVEHFKKLEMSFERHDASTQGLLKNNLQSRLAFFRAICQKKTKSVSLRMAEVANDDRVSQMNSAQQADYLRSAQATSNSKSLAKRAIKQGLDFDSIAATEVKAMKAHLKELDGIDDSTHYVSFYSQETTLRGIKAVCDLVDDQNTIDNMSALEILQLLNIVGIPCVGPIGDFPDPKTYHPEEIMLGSFVSMSDVIMVKQGGQTLRDPYSNKEIINVVPFYDDDRIQQFLMKYGKTLLEYTASLGMRNMIVDVPHTYKYTIVGGLWNMARRLNDERTAVNVDVFMKLVISYRTAVDHIFDYVVDFIREPSESEKRENRSYYISNNGTTNMISPLITLVEEHVLGKNVDRIRFIPNILRALYSFEIYQVIRKFNRSDDDKLDQRKKMLDQLLGIDLQKYATVLPPMFEEPGKTHSKHHDSWHVNDQMLDDLISRFWWVDHITNLPDYLLNAFKGSDGKNKILGLPKLSDERILEVLGLRGSAVSLRTFKLYCIVQSFLFDSKADRVADNNQMLIEDCGNSARMELMVRSYIEKQYRADFQARLDKQHKLEREVLAQELVNQMALADKEEVFLDLFKVGLKRNHVSVVISDAYQLGFVMLKDRLFDPKTEVKLRKFKLIILVMGIDRTGKIIWNKGNALRAVPLSRLKEAFIENGMEKFWNETLYPTYKRKNIYSYRDSDKPNRHTHCNSKASFWAFGYKSVGKYFANISEAERQEYMKIHTHCCGIWDGKLVKPA